MKRALQISLLVLIAGLASVHAQPRFQNPLTRIVSLDEEQPAGTALRTASDGLLIDLTVTNPDNVDYTLSLDNDRGLFILSGSSLETAVAIDREMPPTGVNFAGSLDLTVMINYMSGGEMIVSNSTVTVRVTVNDINDNLPVWTRVPIPEIQERVLQALNRYTIIVLTVTDADVGMNALLTYQLISPLDRNIQVNADGSVIFTSSPFDVLNTDLTIPVEIRVTDGGSPRLSTTIDFNVIIRNELELPPVFTQPRYTADLTENTAGVVYTNEPIVTVEASHSTFSAGINDILFSFLFTPTPAPDEDFSFAINTRRDGADFVADITFSGTVDRERRPHLFVTLQANEVLESDTSVVTSLDAIATLEIEILDINDNAPIFFNNAGNPDGDIPYVASVPESASLGHVVVDDAQAFDLDEGTNKAFQYAIEDGVPFTINSGTGAVTVSGSLDFEMDTSYTFEIYAMETQTSTRLTGTATVEVTITNVNDNTPSFPQAVYMFSTPEGPSTGVPLSTVQASDVDSGEFGMIESYSLTSAISDSPFDVSPDGEIFVRDGAVLDRETRDSYHLSLIATDGGGLTATTLLVISVLDVNDEAPRFIPDYFTLILRENTDYNPALTALATDADEPNTLNTQITYSISPTTYSRIDSSSGVVVISGLDFEATTAPHHTVIFTITATDGGPNRLTGTATINVTVLDSGEAAPVFNQLTYSAEIAESHNVGDPIPGLVVMATDSEGHDISYSVVNTLGGGSFFSVDSSSGQISLAHEVDFDPPNNDQILVFQVLAVDNGVPPGTGMATVTVTVTNANDNAPVITNPPATDPTRLSLVEKEGTSVPRPLFTVQAEDDDADDVITFTRTGSDKFSVDASSGEVTLTATLDRAVSATEQFTIMACDTGSQCDSVTITVTVEDYNDNPPVFVGSPYSRSISECMARADVSVLRATAEDTVDIGPNSEIEYSLLSGDGFSVGATTGEIRTVGDNWDFESGVTSFSGMVRATDNPSGTVQLTADASFTLDLTDCNDNAPVFGSSGEYHISIMEGSTSTSNPILTVTTSDLDSSEGFRTVTYEIVGGTPETNGWIDIDSNGNLNIVAGQTIDREHNFLQISSNGEGHMIFNILARNVELGPDGTTLEDTATVTVLITDINDNDPVIQNPDIMQVSVVENAANGSILAVISATDADYGDNAHISYSIVGGNAGNTFAMNPENGYLTVAVQGNLDHEGTNEFTLTIRAENDRATPPGTPDEITVVISLIGTNDHSPIFDMPQYTANLREYHALEMTNGAAVNSTVQTVHATDGDGADTPAGQIEYRIVSGNTINGEKIFEILIPSQGAVFVVRPDLIDYEMRTQFDIVIEAYDLVSPFSQRRQDSAHLIVTILDENDNIPMFANLFYNATIVEEQDTGTQAMVIPSIRATDEDMMGLDPLRFRLESAHPFTISADGTSVTTTARIDRETTTSFSVVVFVQDSEGHESTAPLQIEVIDINDNAPRFLRTPADLQVNIPENLDIFPNPDSLIQRVEAVDNDEGNNAQITYILSGGRGNFDIVPTSGQVRLIAPLDRDTIASRYALNVTATDGTLASWLVFNVIIDNINDNNPVFLEVSWEGSIAEDATVMSSVLVADMTAQVPTVLQLYAEDLDPESNVTYFLSPESASLDLPFRITYDGYIVTTRTLDRELEERYSFFVRATDGFRESLDDAPVEVIIQDVNDNQPMFEQPSYTTDVYENTPARAIFLILQANDDDIGTNAEIMYSIASVDPPMSTGFFEIFPESGGVYPTQTVTVSQGEPTTITLQVTATDKGQPAMSMTVPVELNLVDANANAPVFDQILYMLTVRENELNAIVGSTVAMDPTGDVNNVISYRILDNTDGYENFFINNATGEIRTAASLNREEEGFYTVTISATDSDPILPRTGFATVVVTVEDVNDNTPYFDPPSYPIAISESTDAGSTLIQVTAFDNDIGTNAQLTYRILSGDTSVFDISIDGEICTLTMLDRETTASYNLVIEVSDSPENARTALSNVTITINDVNDNSPTFTAGAVLSPDPVLILEDAESGSMITTIKATDPDFQLNGIVNYYFQNLTLTRGPFQINRETGAITLRSGDDGELDRERVDFYELTVIAADLRGLGPPGTVRTTTGVVRVVVLDINDNVPTFIDPLYEFTIPEAYPLNTQFGLVQGDDADIGTNADLYYHLIGESKVDQNTSCANQFCIDLLTGDLTLDSTLDRETTDFHLLTIAVSNNMVLEFNDTTGAPTAASTGSVSVTVTDTNDQSPMFVESSLSAVVAEEAPFGATVTTLQAIDEDTLNGSIVWFEILTPMASYLVDRDTGVVTTAGVFTGLSGTLDMVKVRAYDNFGEVPTFATEANMEIQVFKNSEQVIITFSRDKETIEAKIERIRGALVEATEAGIIITEVRVELTEAGEVDISGTDVLFFALDSVGVVINPAVIIRTIDQNYALVEDVFTECRVTSIRINEDPPTPNPIPVWLWVVLGILGTAVLCMCCCFLIGCVVERRRSRRWKKKANTSMNSGEDQFSRMADYNTNPLWVNPYEGMEYTSSTVSTETEQENSNPLYESQELTIEMFQDDGEEDTQSSSSKRGARQVKAPPLTIPDPVVKRSDGMYDSQEIEIHMEEELDEPDSESDVQLLRTSTPQGLAGKRGGKSRAHYSRDDELLDEAVGRSYL